MALSADELEALRTWLAELTRQAEAMSRRVAVISRVTRPDEPLARKPPARQPAPRDSSSPS